MSFWDTSALAKLYLTESDSALFIRLAESHPITLGVLAKRELRTVFTRREAEQAIAVGDADVLYERALADMASGALSIRADSDEVERHFLSVLKQCYAQVPPIFIRTNDAVHLAFALAAEETEFVTADFRQRTAAALLGFTLPI